MFLTANDASQRILEPGTRTPWEGYIHSRGLTASPAEGTGDEEADQRPEDVVRESLAGLALAHPDILSVSFDPIYVVRADAPVQGKVGVVSGGGSGHEPMHGGYVGRGMLDAACPGPGLHLAHAGPDRGRHPGRRTAAPACCTSSRTTPATS